jgi:hypothetical protein
MMYIHIAIASLLMIVQPTDVLANIYFAVIFAFIFNPNARRC